MYAASLCNDASFNLDKPQEVIGDPTEGALLPLVQDFGYSALSLKKNIQDSANILLIPFASECQQFMK